MLAWGKTAMILAIYSAGFFSRNSRIAPSLLDQQRAAFFTIAPIFFETGSTS